MPQKREVWDELGIWDELGVLNEMGFLDELSVMFVEPFLSCHLAMKILRKSCQQCSQSPKSIKV